MPEAPIKRPPRSTPQDGASGPNYGGATPTRRAVSTDARERAKEPGDTTYSIRTANEQYAGYTLGVRFMDGEGSTQNVEIARKLRDDFGYSVEPDPGHKEGPPPPVRLPDERQHDPERDVPFFPRDSRLAPGADPRVAVPDYERKEQGDGEQG